MSTFNMGNGAETADLFFTILNLYIRSHSPENYQLTIWENSDIQIIFLSPYAMWRNHKKTRFVVKGNLFRQYFGLNTSSIRQYA